MELNNYLITPRGYKIPLDDKNINFLKKELMVLPYTENAVRFPVFRISDKYLYIPKFYGISKYGIPISKNIKEQYGIPVKFEFKNSLREYQVNICHKILNHIKLHGSGLASIYTGWGKTAAALWIASQLGIKTLIIVHTENLLEQWKERIYDFLGIEDNEIGIIRGPRIDIDNKNICIGMVQSISMKEYSPDTFKEFGLTIYDECHRLGCRIFSKIFYKVGTRHNLGLSATLTRSDGLTKVIKYFLGDTIVSLKLCVLTPTIIIKYTNIEPLDEKRMVNGKVNLPGMLSELCDSFMRNLEIITIIKEKYTCGRKMLVLSHRRNQCNELKRLLGDEYSSGIYVGGMKNNVLKESNTKRVIFATYQIASEGYDNKELDTLIFASPKSTIEQAVGRILRQENINEPEVIDIVDPWSVFNNLYFSRMKFYKKKKYIISGNSSNTENLENIKLEKCAFIDED